MANNSAMWMGGSSVAAAGVLSLPALILLSVVMVSFLQCDAASIMLWFLQSNSACIF